MDINTAEIKKVVIDQKQEIEDIFSSENIIKREIPEKKLLKFLAYPNILIISGIRRSGKSITSLKLFEGRNYGYINFDDERLSGLQGRDLNKILEVFYEFYGDNLDFFIFDEIQNVPGWQLFINRLRRTKKVILTGSNANLLSGELSTHLTGRYIDFTLYPFSFREFLDIKSIVLNKEGFYSTKSAARIKKNLGGYLSLGGFPEVHKFGRAIISRIYSDILNKDILSRHRIKHRIVFRELAKFLISNFGREIVFARLKRNFSINDVHTIRDYINYLEETYVVFLVEKFSFKLKQQMIAPKKVYCMDTGMINSIGFQFSENKGRLVENIVAIELYRRKAYFDNSLEVYYWKDYSGKEVDFVLKGRRKVKSLVQVCYSTADIEVEERELKSLIAASRELNCSNLLIITWDEEKEKRYEGKTVRYIPLWKWLLIKYN